MKKNIQLALLLLFAIASNYIFAAVAITQGTVTNICNKSGQYVSLSAIKVDEGLSQDFGSITGIFVSSFDILAPTNFEFKPNTGNIIQIGTEIITANITVTASKVHVAIAGNNSILDFMDSFEISGLQVKSDANSFSNVNFITSNNAGNGINGMPNASILATASSVVAGYEQGWNDIYCRNGNLDTISLFPTGGSLVINYPNGTINGTPHTLVGSTLYINPKNIVSGGVLDVNFTYTFANAINGCTQIYRKASVENTTSGLNFSVSGNDFTLSYIISNGISMFGFPSGGFFSGNGVSGNLFIPNAIAGPYPQNSAVTYTRATPISGCKNSITKNFTVFNPVKVFDFSPIPPLEIESPTSFTGWFCANDIEKYSISLSTSTGLQLPETILSSVSGRSVSITAPSIANNTTLVGADYGKEYGVSFTGSVFGNITNFRFIPNLITATGNTDFLLTYNADTINIFGRSRPFAYNSQANQRIVIAAKTPDLTLLSSPSQEFCIGEVTSTNIVSVSGLGLDSYIKWYRVTGTGVNQRQLVATSTGLSLNFTALGVNTNSPIGSYNFAVTQKKNNGCESNAIVFNAIIKPLPSVPGLSNLISNLPSFCADTSYTITLYPNNSTTGYSYFWHKDIVTATGQATISTNYSTDPIIITSTTGYYLTTKLNGCESNRLISTTTGSNPTVGFVPIVFSARPSLPTVLGSNIYCVGNAILPISVAGTYAIATNFRWYTSTTTSNITTLSTGQTSNNSTNYLNLFNTSVSSTLTATTTYYVKSNDIASGCKSKDFLPVLFQIFSNPSTPFVANDNGIGFINGELLNNSKYCFDGLSTTFIGINVQSLETNPTFNWYNASTILGLVTTSTSYVSNSTKSVTNTEIIYVSQSLNGCQSPIKRVIIEINSALFPPTISGLSLFNCTGKPLNDLVASTSIPNGTVRWYSSVTGTLEPVGFPTLTSNSYNPVSSNNITNSSIGHYNFAADVIDNNGCISPKAIATIDFRQTPALAQVFDNIYCAGSFSPGILKVQTPLSSLSGQYLEWYYTPANFTSTGINSTINGGTMLQSEVLGTFLGNNFAENDSILPVQIKNFLYGCESQIATLSVYIRKNPSVPIRKSTYNKLNCVGNNMPIISASLGQDNLKWYTTMPGTGSVPIEIGTTLNTENVISTTSPPVWTSNSQVGPQPNIFLFYNTQTTSKDFLATNITFSGCESQPRVDSVFVYAQPPIPNLLLSTDICVGQSNATITVSGATNTLPGFSPNSTFRWYNNSTTGNTLSLLETFTPSIITNKDTAITYWANQTNYIKSGFSCQSQRAFTKYTIKPLPLLNIINSKNSYAYCVSDNPSTVSGFPLGGNFSSTFLGITTLLGSKCTLNPNQTFTGNLLKSIVQYSYTSISGCSNNITKEFQISIKPTGLSILFESPEINTLAGFCAATNEVKDLILNTNQSSLNIGSEIVNVKFPNSTVVSAILNRKFVPATLFATARQGGSDMETVTVTFKYTINGSGCADSISTTKELYAQPSVTFDEDGNCEKTNITIESSVLGMNLLTGMQYKWSGTAINTFENTTLPTLNGVFTPGAKNIRVTVTSAKGCTAQLTKLINIGSEPNAKFKFKNICQNDVTLFLDSSSIANGKITHRIFDYGDGTALDEATNNSVGIRNVPISQHIFANAMQYYRAVMTITSDLECSSVFTDSIYILPKYVLTTTGSYDANFATTNGWFSESINKNANAWIQGVPSKPNLNGSAGKVWYIKNDATITNTYPIGRSSVINSPCFDFSNYTKPMVSFDIFNDTREGADGTILQYSTNGGQTWNGLGFIDSGINWYNSLNILGNPGNTPQGWSKKKDVNNLTKWNKSSHTLDEVRNQKSIRFRFAFASANQSFSSGETAEGIAVNHFKINKRTKVALLEQFENENSQQSKIASRGNPSIGLKGIDYIVKESPDNIVAIKYHTSFPLDDRFNMQNPSDPSVRILYNSVNNVPYTILDGTVFKGSTFSNQDTFMEDSLKKAALLQTLSVPNFDIELAANSNILNITIVSNIKYSANADTLMVLHVAQIERSVTFLGFNGQTQFESILRQLLPSAAGTTLDLPIQMGEKNTFSVNYSPAAVTNPSMLGFVVFLQNTISKHVEQAAYTGPKIENITTLEKENNLNTQIEIYPNPAQNEVFITSQSENIATISVYNTIGNKIELPFIKVKNGLYSINTTTLNSGLYPILIQLNNNTIIKNKVIIQK